MTINGAHWHLLVNHLPIIGGLLATIVLGYGLFRHNMSIVRLGFGLFVLMSIATFVTNQTGGSAKDYLLSIHDVNEQLVHTHAQAADWANVAMYLTGGLSGLALVWQRAKQFRFLPALIFTLSLVTFGMMANVGRLGGLIMHKELRTEAPVSPATR